MVKKLNFNETSRGIPVQSLDVGDRNIVIDAPNIEITEKGTLGVPAYAYKKLPICKIDKRFDSGQRPLEKPVVLVKGTIVSLLTDQTVVTDGMVNPAASGEIPQYESVITGSIVNASIDDDYFGYDQSVNALLVPANGGEQSELAYSELDNEYGAWTKSTDADLELAANIPAGIVYNDVYMDIRGAALNYELQGVSGIAREGYITLPYVDTDQVANFGDADNVGTSPANDGYDAVYKKYAFYAFDGSANEAVSGALVQSDKFGRFVFQANAIDASANVQTVGKVLTTTSRFPRELTDEIQAFPGHTLPSRQTKGLPTDLYLFVKDVLTATEASVPTADEIADAVKNGKFGYVRILFDV